jgi:hypothetical protein
LETYAKLKAKTVQNTLLQAIARSGSWMDAVLAGKTASFNEIASAEGLAEVLINQADIKSAGGVAPRVRTQAHAAAMTLDHICRADAQKARCVLAEVRCAGR